MGTFFMHLLNIRYLLLSIVTLVSFFSSLAEDKDSANVKSKRNSKLDSQWVFHWGPKAGIDFLQIERPFSFSTPAGNEMGIGVGAGLNGRFEWKNRFYIQPGLMVSYDTAAASVADDYDVVDNTSGSFRIRRGSLMLPVHFGYKFYVTTDLYMTLFTGAWASYGFAGTIDYNPGPLGTPDSEFVDYLYGPNGAWNRIGAGIALGLTFDIGAKLTVNVDGYLGLNHMAERNIFYSNYMSESLGRISLCYWLGSINL